MAIRFAIQLENQLAGTIGAEQSDAGSGNAGVISPTLFGTRKP